MAEEFNLTVKLRHEFGGWYRYVGQHSGRESITAEQALEWAALAGDDVVEEVKTIIRADADEAEASAARAHERSTAEAARLAQDAVNAHRRALVRREEATKLAPIERVNVPGYRVREPDGSLGNMVAERRRGERRSGEDRRSEANTPRSEAEPQRRSGQDRRSGEDRRRTTTIADDPLGPGPGKERAEC